MEKYCRICKRRTHFKSFGWKNYNERYECNNCGLVFIPLMVRLFGKYRNYPKYIEKWESFV